MRSQQWQVEVQRSQSLGGERRLSSRLDREPEDPLRSVRKKSRKVRSLLFSSMIFSTGLERMRLHCVWCWPEWEEGPASAFWPCHPPGQPGRTTINILLQFNPFLFKNYIYVSCISLHLFSLEVKSEHLMESESLYYRIVLSIITLPQELGFWWFYKIQDTLYSEHVWILFILVNRVLDCML